MISNLNIEPKCQGHSKNLKISVWGTKNMPPVKNSAEISLVTDVQLICEQVMNDLLTIIKVGLQRSRMIRLNIITARRWQVKTISTCNSGVW